MISKHLIKTICTDIVNDMLRFLGNEQMIAFNEDNMTSEVSSLSQNNLCSFKEA